MPNAVSADPSERLPWLSDPAFPQPRQPRRSWLPLVISLSAVGAIAFGGWAFVERGTAPEPAPIVPAETVPLPPPQVTSPIGAEPQAPTAAEWQALQPTRADPPVAARPVTRAEPTVHRSATPTRSPPAQREAPAAAPAYDPRAWQSGVPGRIIQLGAFATSAQAQREWRRFYSRFPLLRPLSPRVIKSRVRGRTYHRLQLGTFSQAHSELLCQRLKTLDEGCIVLGMPSRGQAG